MLFGFWSNCKSKATKSSEPKMKQMKKQNSPIKNHCFWAEHFWQFPWNIGSEISRISRLYYKLWSLIPNRECKNAITQHPADCKPEHKSEFWHPRPWVRKYTKKPMSDRHGGANLQTLILQSRFVLFSCPAAAAAFFCLVQTGCGGCVSVSYSWIGSARRRVRALYFILYVASGCWPAEQSRGQGPPFGL